LHQTHLLHRKPEPGVTMGLYRCQIGQVNVFLVTFGQKQSHHEFDEGVTPEGILRWQSQPGQGFINSWIKDFIAHDDDRNSIYLFLRTAEKRDGQIVPYTYLGRLRYSAHNRDLEKPVYFTWQILDWSLPEEVQKRIRLKYELNSDDESISPPVNKGI
jgi:Domain of unknown function (DUF3427)